MAEKSADGQKSKPSGRMGRRSAKQSNETRMALLDAAASIFAERGLNGATVEDIAKRAGVTKGAIYSHFDGREDLLVRACRSALESFNLFKLAEEAPDLNRFVLETAKVLLADKGRDARMLNVESHLSAARSQKIADLLSEWYEAAIDVVGDRVPSAAGSPRSILVMINVLFLGLSHKDAFQSLDIDTDELLELTSRMTNALLMTDDKA